MAIIDQKGIMISRLLAQFEGKTRLEGVVGVLGDSLNAFEKIMDDLEFKRWIDAAEGVQLDGLGQIVGQSRIIPSAILIPFFGFENQPSGRGFGVARFRHRFESSTSTSTLGDESYRMLIKAKIFKNTSICTPEQIISACAFVYGADTVILQESGNAKIRIGIGKELTEEQKALSNALNLIPKPGGVGIEIKSTFSGSVFGFRHQGFKGFGEGVFAKVF